MNACPALRPDARMALGIDQDDAVLIEQTVVPFDEDGVIAFIPEADPRAAVGQRISPHFHRGIERGSHARSHLAIPLAGVRSGIDACLLP